MRTDISRVRRPGLLAATAALIAAGITAGVGVAGARENVTLYSVENGLSPCFAKNSTGPCGDAPVVTVQTGDKVTWNFSGAVATNQYHNAASKSSAPANAAWDARPADDIRVGGTQEWTFGTAGTYEFKCSLHPTMVGTVIVEGGTVETPTATPTEEPEETEEPSVTATPTFAATVPPGATATPDDHLTTPAPGKGAPKDTEAPRLQNVTFKRVAAGAQLRFWLSEQSTLTAVITRKGAKLPVTSATRQVPLGTRALVLGTRGLARRGTYTVELRVVDAMGNKGATTTKTLKVK